MMGYRLQNVDAGGKLTAETAGNDLGGLAGSCGIRARDFQSVGGSQTDMGDDLLKTHAKAPKPPADAATDVKEAHVQSTRRLDFNRGVLRTVMVQGARHLLVQEG
jgi:hypothetical protein